MAVCAGCGQAFPWHQGVWRATRFAFHDLHMKTGLGLQGGFYHRACLKDQV